MKNIRVLIDTNVILDWIMVREPNATNAKLIMEQCIFGHIQGYVTSHSLTDIFIFLGKIILWKNENSCYSFSVKA